MSVLSGPEVQCIEGVPETSNRAVSNNLPVKRAESIFLWYTSNLIFTIPTGRRIWRSHTDGCKFLKCLMFVAFMESVSLNSPDSYSVTNCKEGVYSTHMYWISNSCGPSARARSRKRRPWEPSPPCYHSSTQQTLAGSPRTKGHSRVWGCSTGGAACPPWASCYPHEFSPPGQSPVAPEDSSFLLHYSCPRAVGTTRRSPH